MDVQAAIVVDEAQLSELIQEETHPGPGGADHLGERFLTDLRNHVLRLPVLPKVGQQQEHPRQPRFARIEELIDQVLFDPAVARQQVPDQPVRHRRLGVHHRVLPHCQRTYRRVVICDECLTGRFFAGYNPSAR